jgi:hypothetical protein
VIETETGFTVTIVARGWPTIHLSTAGENGMLNELTRHSQVPCMFELVQFFRDSDAPFRPSLHMRVLPCFLTYHCDIRNYNSIRRRRHNYSSYPDQSTNRPQPLMTVWHSTPRPPADQWVKAYYYPGQLAGFYSIELTSVYKWVPAI